MPFFARAVVLLALAAPGAAQAQMSFAGPLSPGAFEATMNTGPIAQALRQQEDARPPRQRVTRAPTAPARPVAAADAASLRFVSTPARRKASFDTYLARTRAKDPAGSASLARDFANRDFIGLLDAPLAEWGLRTDNLADAYTMWWISAWSASHGHNQSPPRTTVAAVKRQVESAMLSTGQFAGANDAMKQQFADGLLIHGALIDATVEQSQGKPEVLEAIRGYVRQSASAMGVDLAAVRLTPAGFVPAR